MLVSVALMGCTPEAGIPTRIGADPTGTYTADNPEMGITAVFDDGGATVEGSSFVVDVEPLRFGRNGLFHDFDLVDATLDEGRIEYEQPGILSWFVSGPSGVEHGFDVFEAPEGEEELQVEVLLRGEEFWSTGPDSIVGRSDGEWVHYSGLFAEDDLGTELATTMSLDCRTGECVATLHIDDADAVYPVHIDPTFWVEVMSNPAALTVEDLVVGDLVVTEWLANPTGSEANREWFEILNTTTDTINIEGLRITDQAGGSQNEVTVADQTPDVEIAPGEHFLFATTADASLNGGLPTPGYVYSYGNGNNAMQLGNSGDEIILRADNMGVETVVDALIYLDGEPNGATWSVNTDSLDEASNDDEANWCDGLPPYGVGMFGTPGAMNDDCSFDLVLDFFWEFDDLSTVDGCVVVSYDHGTARFTTTDGGEGTFERATSGSQQLDWLYQYDEEPDGTFDGNGPTYFGSRAPGETMWPDSEMDAPGLGVTANSRWLEVATPADCTPGPN